MTAGNKFALHPKLKEDSLPLGRLEISRVLLMNDARFPWCLLVPEIDGATEIHLLDPGDQLMLMRESVVLSKALVEAYRPDKLNVAALGNQVPQLHLHHIARFRSDAAWPHPVWGVGRAVAYEPASLSANMERLANKLGAVAAAAQLDFRLW
jgi:diadenosine tetraphosphate (Ap4A) HIT family hydrolase